MEELVEAGVVLQHGLLHVFPGERALNQAVHRRAGFLPEEVREMALREIAGMRGHEIEELCFRSRVAEALKRRDVFLRNVHRARMSVIRCGSCSAPRTRDASSRGA
jgi:hypothetical protein